MRGDLSWVSASAPALRQPLLADCSPPLGAIGQPASHPPPGGKGSPQMRTAFRRPVAEVSRDCAASARLCHRACRPRANGPERRPRTTSRERRVYRSGGRHPADGRLLPGSNAWRGGLMATPRPAGGASRGRGAISGCSWLTILGLRRRARERCSRGLRVNSRRTGLPRTIRQRFCSTRRTVSKQLRRQNPTSLCGSPRRPPEAGPPQHAGPRRPGWRNVPRTDS